MPKGEGVETDEGRGGEEEEEKGCPKERAWWGRVRRIAEHICGAFEFENGVAHIYNFSRPRDPEIHSSHEKSVCAIVFSKKVMLHSPFPSITPVSYTHLTLPTIYSV